MTSKFDFSKYKTGLYFALMVFLFGSCNEPSDVGMELLPTTDLISVSNSLDKSSIRAYTFTDDSVRTDEPSTCLLGSINDPVFGKTAIDLAMQLRLSSYPKFGTNPVADSIKLFLYYRSIFGDTLTVQKIKVFELNQSIDIDSKHYHTEDLSKLASTKEIGNFDFVPKVKLDSASKDTNYQLLSIKLDKSLGQKLVSADSLDLINNDAFLNYFKGLFIQSVQSQQNGSIISLELLGSSTFQGSAMVVYYRNNEYKDSVLNKPFLITSFSARINSFRHDYSQTAFFSQLNKENRSDSLIYVQSTGGIQSKVFIPSINNWKDSSRIAINKAELIFQLDTTVSEFRKYPIPTQLLLTFIGDNNVEDIPRDYYFYPAYYGGYLVKDYTYRFNITQHMQSIVKGTIQNRGFFLTTSQKNGEMRRAVLKGTSSAKGVRFLVTYSKLLQ